MAERSKKNKRTSGKGQLGENLKFVILIAADILVVFFVLLSLFMLVSLFFPFTGKIGRAFYNFSNTLLGSAGVIIWLYILYLGIKVLLKGFRLNFLFEALSVFLLYLVAAEIVGLADYLNIRLPFKLYSGLVGEVLVVRGMEYVGGFGLILFGFLMLLLSASLLGGIRPVELFKVVFSKVYSKKDEKIKEFLETEEAESLTEDRYSIDEETGNKEIDHVVKEYNLKRIVKKTIGKDDNENQEEGTSKLEAIEDKLVFPPPVELLPVGDKDEDDQEIYDILSEGAKRIEQTLKQFNIQAEVVDIVVGPTVIQYQLKLAPGVKVGKVASLSRELAMALASLAEKGLRIEAPIPGKSYVGIEIPNPNRKTVFLRDLIDSSAYKDADFDLPVVLGVDVVGDIKVVGLERLPHLLIAGTTGSGKSVFISSLILSLVYKRKPEDLKFILIDPKRVELTAFSTLPHLLTQPITNSRQALSALGWAIAEMENRYRMFATLGVRDIFGYNALVSDADKMEFIVIIIDELADLMMTSPKEVEDYICRLAQMARATGIHLVLATQRPSVNVVTGLIKANVPARIAFSLPSQADSRTIIDCGGAEKLLGKGDMLFVSTQNPKPIRLQAPWVDEKTVAKVVSYLERLFGKPTFIDILKQVKDSAEDDIDADLSDPLFPKAVDLVLSTGIASASMLQRRLRVGFSRASRLIDAMERLGIVGPMEGSKPRDILVSEEEARKILKEKEII